MLSGAESGFFHGSKYGMPPTWAADAEDSKDRTLFGKLMQISGEPPAGMGYRPALMVGQEVVLNSGHCPSSPTASLVIEGPFAADLTK